MKSLVFLVLLTIHAFGGGAAGWENPLREKLAKMAADLTASLKPWNVPSRSFEVENHGAVADGVTLNTTTIQKTIDECSTAGGGVVLFSKGDYVTGTLVLKSGVMLEISENSRILGSTDLADYPDHIASRKTVMDTHMKVKQSLIVAEGVERVGLRGPGTIDFRGAKSNFPGNQTIAETPGRPFGMRFIDSKKIVVEHITLTNSACWMQNYLNCEDLIFQKMTVINNANYNNDGIDIDGCRRVILRDCKINSEDDAFCLKGASLRPNEDLLIENSTFYSTCNAFKIGTQITRDTNCQNLLEYLNFRSAPANILDRAKDALNRDSGFQLFNGPTLENQASYQYQATTCRLGTVSGGGFQPPSLSSTFTYGYLPNKDFIQTVTGPIHTTINSYEPARDLLDTKTNQLASTVISRYDYAVNEIGQRTGLTTSGTAFPNLEPVPEMTFF